MPLRARITAGGKIVIPYVYRKQLNLKEGEEVIIDLQEGNIVISSLNVTLAKVRNLVSKYHNEEENLVEKLGVLSPEEAAHE